MLSIPTFDLPYQIPLIEFVEIDDLYLAEADVLWFKVLRELDWRPFVPVAAQYYEALWEFNQDQALERERKKWEVPVPNPETKKEATQRLLHERSTLDASRPVLADTDPAYRELRHVDEKTIRPGVLPPRFQGKTPKDFFALLKAFLGLIIKGRAAEPESVHEELIGNPAYARTCGFTLPVPGLYHSTDTPSLRKLQQFDQIMSDNKLWGQLAAVQIKENFEKERLKLSKIGAHDTVHYHAWSTMKVPEVEGKVKNGKPLKKSHPKTTKRCRCESWQDCFHDWVSADDGAGTVVKAGGKMHWAHKASTFTLDGFVPEIPISAIAMTDAATHDSRSLIPHLERIKKLLPEVIEHLEIILDDSALDDDKIKAEIKERFGIDLIVEPNHRNRKPIVDDLPKGIDHITGRGTPVCKAGFPFDFRGARKTEELFHFQSPDDKDGDSVCKGCSQRDGCIRPEAERRHLSIPFAKLPFVNPGFPHLSVRFKKLTGKRTVIERCHKLMKFDRGSEQLTKRGTTSYQATLDKTLLVMHVVLAHD